MGCDFFQELESTAQDETSTGGEDTGDEASETGETGDGGPCEAIDDRCDSQDVLHSCDLDSGELTELNCASACGGGAFMNFTCLMSPSGAHGCWCVLPGEFALDGCAQLEACLGGCTTDACADSCFGRASVPSIRLLGALFHCAETDCAEFCEESIEACNSCILATRAGVYGGCGVERSVCDADTVDEIPWP